MILHSSNGASAFFIGVSRLMVARAAVRIKGSEKGSRGAYGSRSSQIHHSLPRDTEVIGRYSWLFLNSISAIELPGAHRLKLYWMIIAMMGNDNRHRERKWTLELLYYDYTGRSASSAQTIAHAEIPSIYITISEKTIESPHTADNLTIVSIFSSRVKSPLTSESNWPHPVI